jgi:WD40 repeat protein
VFDVDWPHLRQQRFWPHELPVASAAWTDDDRAILTATRDGSFFEWDAMPPPAEAKVISTGDGSRFLPIDVDETGRIVAGGFGEIKIWDADRVNPPRRAEVPAGHITSVAFVSNRDSVVVGHSDGSVLLWNLLVPGIPTVLGRHDSRDADVLVRTAADPGIVLTSAADGAVHAWPLDGSKGWTVDDVGRPVAVLAVKPDGDLAAWALARRCV